ncbi:T9SS type A sorting domain-containing protein [Gracilimonas sediminicola]|uniref:T9SS type A sorting domain-containing protein n=1 Tax=Gracilimonas sediminicola TaxID=2952158 RepID=A0A9X2L490_9BACT|nr:T9SS type A sorting domain-containing protein [Gracilimonas sediminicola]MCP9291999.1 T9SS type A sorting domain-containing protein [Gracilimonas sediminicola]
MSIISTKQNIVKKAVTFSVIFFSLLTGEIFGQVQYKWLDVGSFHNFYSNMGSEREEGFIPNQQAGWQWPAIYKAQDAQASKALWLGVTNFTDSAGTQYENRVVHVGPRVSGEGEFFPVEIKLISKFPKPEVYLFDELEDKNDSVIDDVDPNLEADRVLYSKTNTLIGVTVERKVMQFSQQYHDNYHIIEYIFTNTGNTDADSEIELPNQSIEGFIPFFKNQMAPVKQSRYTIGNATGWGINTMYDRRGDGLHPEEKEDFRASFAWHGYFPNFAYPNYDNIGAPIITPNTAGGYLASDDTTGRLAAYHFVGTVTLHADASSSNPDDDPEQPFTMSEEHNDHPLFSNNDAFNIEKMNSEYEMMSVGRTSPRHAFQVESEGYEGFTDPGSDPSLGQGGGFSYTSGYGPYSLEPGDSVRIVVAEASAGISRKLAYETGLKFKNGEITDVEKNEVVFQGRDSLFQTFERALANFKSGYQIPSAPKPPSKFEIASTDTGIVLEWEYDQSLINNIERFEIYRASEKVDSTYRLLYKADNDERLIVDGEPSSRRNYPGYFLLDSPVRGTNYYYYIVAVGETNVDSTGNTPIGSRLKSSRYYTQTYNFSRTFQPVSNEREVGRVTGIELYQNYPNPFNPSTTISFRLDRSEKIKIQIFNLTGQSVATLVDGLKNAGTHNVEWNATDFASGVYFYRLEMERGDSITKKLILLK